MGRVPDWDEVHGWHEFEPGWQGPDWCRICDCLKSDHKPKAETLTIHGGIPLDGM